MNVPIAFFRPFLTGKEESYIQDSLSSRNFSGDGPFSKRCEELLRELTGKTVFLTPSGTHALELAMVALNLEAGSEVILPSFTFSSTANAVINAGLKPVFVDIHHDTLNIDENLIKCAITPKTKAIIPVHYAGVGCNMDAISELAKKYGLKILEDAAQGIGAFYDGKPLGAIGDLGVYSFHHTKNITCGEGGALIVTNESYLNAIEIHREKGTSRSQFIRGEIHKYTWMDRGTSALMADNLAAFLYAQLLALNEVTQARKSLYNFYFSELGALTPDYFRLPVVPEKCRPNFHLFFLLLEDKKVRDRLMDFLKTRGIATTFHFVPLHNAPAAHKLGIVQTSLPVTEKTSDTILRLPLYPDLTRGEQEQIVAAIRKFFKP